VFEAVSVFMNTWTLHITTSLNTPNNSQPVNLHTSAAGNPKYETKYERRPLVIMGLTNFIKTSIIKKLWAG
jgi:hypothetical protein